MIGLRLFRWILAALTFNAEAAAGGGTGGAAGDAGQGGAGGAAGGAGAAGAGGGAAGAGAGAGAQGGAQGGQGGAAGGQGGAGGAGSGAAGGAGAGAGGAAGGKAGEPSLLSQGAAGAKAEDSVELNADDPAKWIPEKYRVMVGEGAEAKLDEKASYKKLADAHVELERRAGSIGLPPEKPADYKVTLPAESPLKIEALDGPVMEKFRAEAHAAGYTQKQFDAAISAHITGLGNFMDAIAEQGATLAKTELEADAEWKGEKLKPQMTLAYRTFAAYATPEEAKEIDRIGNNPIFLKVLARVGKDLGEDRLRASTGVGSVIDDGTLESYMAEGSPYWDPTHKDHKKVKDIVTRHHQAKFGNKPVPASVQG